MLADLPILKKGDNNDRVRALQDALNRLGYGLVMDGIYGVNTEQAVRLFQTKYGLVADGIVGNVTLARLQEVVIGAANKGPLLPNAQAVQAGLLTGMFDRFQQPGVTGYPLWLEAITALTAVFATVKLVEFNKK